MEIQRYLRSLLEGWWIVLSVLLLSTGAAIAYSFSQQPTYEAIATLVTQTSQHIPDVGDTISGLDTLAGRSGLVATYCDILESRAIAEAGVTSLGLPTTVLEDYTATCVVLPDSSVMQLTVQGPNPNLTTDLANAMSTQGIDYVASLQEIYILRLLDPAVVPEEPIAPVHSVNVGYGAIIGLMGGVAAVFLRMALTEQRASAAAPAPEATAVLEDRPAS